ncbi:MAG: hypothetical protein ACLQG3_06280 [Terracidiphilus sp.]
MPLSNKGKELLDLYAAMARDGYATTDRQNVESAYNDMEMRAFREPLRKVFAEHRIATLLDYGCGGSDYESPGFHEGLSALEYFHLEKVFRYEPARNIDERQRADAVLCFDVLEHVFISDLPQVVRELYSLAERLLVVNVACYPARALLPNGENAHITVRQPQWWKGFFDAISVEFPSVSVWLLCSTSWRKADAFSIWSGSDWMKSPTFATDF